MAYNVIQIEPLFFKSYFFSPLDLHCFKHIFPFQHHEVAVADAVIPGMRWLWARLLVRALHDAQPISELRGVSLVPRAPPLV